MKLKTQIVLELWSGRIHQQSSFTNSESTARIIAKNLEDKYGSAVKWLCVYNDEEIFYEYIDSYYLELLETLYNRNPNKVKDKQYYKNLLTDLSESNPLLFDKYLDYFNEIA